MGRRGGPETGDVVTVAPRLPPVLLDVPGNAAVRAAHPTEQSDLRRPSGMHVFGQGRTAEPGPGVASIFFSDFSSLEQIRRRNPECGPAAFQRRFNAHLWLAGETRMWERALDRRRDLNSGLQ
jgi:hypothetical protein